MVSKFFPFRIGPFQKGFWDQEWKQEVITVVSFVKKKKKKKKKKKENGEKPTKGNQSP